MRAIPASPRLVRVHPLQTARNPIFPDLQEATARTRPIRTAPVARAAALPARAPCRAVQLTAARQRRPPAPDAIPAPTTGGGRTGRKKPHATTHHAARSPLAGHRT